MKHFLKKLNAQRLSSYDADPGLLKEHAGIEQAVLAGGYGYRQILELVQNGADALLEAHERGIRPQEGNRIVLRELSFRVYSREISIVERLSSFRDSSRVHSE